ncbi:endonuclease domain-containing protein [Alcaligenes faecalis]|uniref:endonuclease domain-containing protein n=1 Tax=Alcaligenes faecalis TaxID=511 RepID=UPI0034D54593
MDFSNWVERNQDKLGSEYEILFAERVLPLVEGLRCDQVKAQHHFIDSDGKNRYCDFVIVESDIIRVAIEIDGYDKRGTGTGMSYEDFLDWQRRQASLASQGWHVLRFANRDVRDAPSRCAEHISELLNRLRKKQTGRVEIVTIQPEPAMKSPEATSTPTTTENTGPLAEATVKAPRKRFTMIAMGVITAAVLASLALWNSNREIAGVTDTLPRALKSIPKDSFPPEYVSEEIVSPHTPPVEALALDEVLAPTDRIHTNATNRELKYGNLDCKNPLDWSVAKQHVGQVVTLIGPLLASKSRPDLNGSPTWLDVGNLFPNPERLTVVVWGKNLSNFNVRDLDAMYWFKSVFHEKAYALICIQGTVTEYRGVPQIELEDLSQLSIAFHSNYR